MNLKNFHVFVFAHAYIYVYTHAYTCACKPGLLEQSQVKNKQQGLVSPNRPLDGELLSNPHRATHGPFDLLWP